MLLLPPELQAGGPDQTVAALADPARRARLLAGEQFTPEYLAHVYLATLPAAEAPLAGLPITEAADQAGQPPGEWTLDLLARTGLQVGANLDRPALTDPDLTWLARARPPLRRAPTPSTRASTPTPAPTAPSPAWPPTT